MLLDFPKIPHSRILSWRWEGHISQHSTLSIKLQIAKQSNLEHLVGLRGKNCHLKTKKSSQYFFKGTIVSLECHNNSLTAELDDDSLTDVIIKAVSRSLALDLEELPLLIGSNNSKDKKTIKELLSRWMPDGIVLGELGNKQESRLIPEGQTLFSYLVRLANAEGGFFVECDDNITFKKPSHESIDIYVTKQRLYSGIGNSTTSHLCLFDLSTGAIKKKVKGKPNDNKFESPLLSNIESDLPSDSFIKDIVSSRMSWQGEVDVLDPQFLLGETIKPNADIYLVGELLVTMQVIECNCTSGEINSFIRGSNKKIAPVTPNKNYSTYIPGYVIGHHDPDQRGRIQVKFPWNSETESSFVETLSDTWGEADNQWHGTLLPPEINDWVLVHVTSLLPPICLGALHKGGKSRVQGVDPTRDRVIWKASGYELAVRNNSLILCVSNNNEVQAQLTLSQQGAIKLSGKDISVSVDDKTLFSLAEALIKIVVQDTKVTWKADEIELIANKIVANALKIEK